MLKGLVPYFMKSSSIGGAVKLYGGVPLLTSHQRNLGFGKQLFGKHHAIKIILVPFVLILLRIEHLPSQCYQYVAFASMEPTAKAKNTLALEQFIHSRDLGRLIVSVFFFSF